MLKQRLLYGTLMTILFIAVAVLDGWMDGSLATSDAEDKPIQGTLLCIFILLLVISSQFEMSRLAAAKELRIFMPFSILASILFATTWYWPQLIEIPPRLYLPFLSAFVLMGLVLYQYLAYGTNGVLANCSANYFSIIYVGLLAGFILAMRIDFGLWAMLMFVFVVKSADIGAYAIGKSFGKHKFSPKISPGKTWEGMAGAVAAAVIVAVAFALISGIMAWLPALVFGVCFAFIGQLGDLMESMIKRDAEQKDSANKVPGFGGMLDLIDSPLVAAPFAYLFFLCS